MGNDHGHTARAAVSRTHVEIHGLANAGLLPLLQVSATEFEIGARLRFRNPTVERRVVEHLTKLGVFDDVAEREAAVQRAASYEPRDGTTDLASIPQFMRWLVNTYGRHTLAAIIHDKLITTTPNGGALRSDVVSDRFFREMLGAAGMPFFLRWVVWTAVALRSRWSAGAAKRLKVLLWGLTSIVGIVGTIALLANDQAVAAFGFGAGLLLVAAALWGRQWGAAVVAAIALPWIAPAVVVVLIATVFFWLLDRIGRRAAPRPPPA